MTWVVGYLVTRRPNATPNPNPNPNATPSPNPNQVMLGHHVGFALTALAVTQSCNTY